MMSWQFLTMIMDDGIGMIILIMRVRLRQEWNDNPDNEGWLRQEWNDNPDNEGDAEAGME